MRFCNNAAVLDDGTIWFHRLQHEVGIDDWKSDLIEDTRTGRLLRPDARWQARVVLNGLSFANGVARSGGGDFVVVAETGHRRLRKVMTDTGAASPLRRRPAAHPTTLPSAPTV